MVPILLTCSCRMKTRFWTLLNALHGRIHTAETGSELPFCHISVWVKSPHHKPDRKKPNRPQHSPTVIQFSTRPLRRLNPCTPT